MSVLRFIVLAIIQILFLGALVVVGITVFSAKQIAKDSAADAVLRYKLTATVEVDGTPISASVVQEILAETSISFLPNERGVRLNWRGQALALDIPGRESLFILMQSAKGGGDFARLLLTACGMLNPNLGPAEAVDEVRGFQGSCSILAGAVPLIVHPINESSPPVFERVDPIDMAATMGSSVRFVSLQLETTNEPLSFDIARRLPWLVEQAIPGKFFFVNVHGAAPAIQLGGPEFIKDDF